MSTNALTSEASGTILPRLQQGGSPQHLLVTLLGDYWYDTDRLLPSAAIKHLLEDFGIGEANARAALSRLTKRGSLVTEKSGRNTYYGLSTDAKNRMFAGWDRIARFGSSDTEWDGMWTVATFTMPEQQRDARSALRQKLRWLGLAPLFDGVWVSPRADLQTVLQTFTDLDVKSGTVFRACEVAGSMDMVSAWDLESLQLEYEALITDATNLTTKLEQGNVTAVEALTARTALMDRWRSFPSREPDLPTELLPPNWPRHTAWRLFRELYEGLGPLAELRVRQCVAQHSQELADAVTRRHLANT